VKVILKQRIVNLGNVGDMVTVSDGFARNYLLPRDLAARAESGKMEQIEHERKLIQAREEKASKQAQELAKKIEEISCTITARAAEEDRLFGSVSAPDIVQALRESGIEIDKKHVELKEPIKMLGVYSVPINLGRGVAARLKLWVVRE
jgi:large subunit ribosomal protein L9